MQLWNELKAYRLPVNLYGINDSDIDKIIAITKSDKKADNNCIKFVLIVNGIGNAFTDKTVTDEEMKEALKIDSREVKMNKKHYLKKKL